MRRLHVSLTSRSAFLNP